jgi:hypothetical protein
VGLLNVAGLIEGREQGLMLRLGCLRAEKVHHFLEKGIGLLVLHRLPCWQAVS